MLIMCYAPQLVLNMNYLIKFTPSPNPREWDSIFIPVLEMREHSTLNDPEHQNPFRNKRRQYHLYSLRRYFQVIAVNTLELGLVNFFCEGLDSKYFRLYRP